MAHGRGRRGRGPGVLRTGWTLLVGAAAGYVAGRRAGPEPLPPPAPAPAPPAAPPPEPPSPPARPRRDRTEGLSPREIDVVRLVAAGKANDAIALELGLSRRTIQTHIANAMRKTDSANRTELGVLAVREGLV